MQVTMMGEYAIRAMIFLAAKPKGELVQIPEISKEWKIPENFLRKIIPLLSRGGLIYSQRGSGGGIYLLRPATEITALDVIEAVEGKVYLNRCLFNDALCENVGWCSMHTLWDEAQAKLREVLSSRSIAELAAANEQNKK